jgi:hypothetical protein
VLCIQTDIAIAQTTKLTPDLIENIQLYNLKINELISKNEGNGFVIMKEEKLAIRSDIDFVIHLPLYKDNWYHFCFIGDPGADKIKCTLFLEGLGDIIQDRIKVQRMNIFWTEFSFLCPTSGNYELSLYQKADIGRPLSYLTIFKKNTSTEDDIKEALHGKTQQQPTDNN